MIVCGVLEKNNSFYRLSVAGTVELTKNSRETVEKIYFKTQILTVNYNYFSNQIKVIIHMCINFILIIVKKSRVLVLYERPS